MKRFAGKAILDDGRTVIVQGNYDVAPVKGVIYCNDDKTMKLGEHTLLMEMQDSMKITVSQVTIDTIGRYCYAFTSNG